MISMPDMSDYYLPIVSFCSRFARWDDILAEPAPDGKMINDGDFLSLRRRWPTPGKAIGPSPWKNSGSFPQRERRSRSRRCFCSILPTRS